MVGCLSYIVQQNHPANHPKYCWINPVQQKNIQQSGQRTGRRRRQNAIALADVVSELALVSSTWQSAKARYKINTCRNKRYVIYSWTVEAITKAKGENVIVMISGYPNLPRLMQH